MKKGGFLEQECFDIKNIFRRVDKRDFSGNIGKAVKNSVFSFSTTFIGKIGSILFTIILARLLLPELFGLYSLALSTIILFATLSDLGISNTLIKFVSSSKSAKKSKAYFSYLLKFKLILSLISASLLILSARFIAYNYYAKPIFLALIAGSLYILISGFIGIFVGLFQASNNFKKGVYKEIIFQSSRLILVPLTILFAINYFKTEVLLLLIFIALSFSFLFSFLFIYISAKKEISFLKLVTERLSKREKSKLNKFILSLTALAVSGILFGYIDMFILGRYVEAEFIGFYRAAFSLITSAIPLIAFSSALFPIFSRLKGEQLSRGLKKSLRLTILITIPFFILTLFLSSFIIKIIFGAAYLQSINILRLFSVLILILPLISIYSSFLISQNKPKKVAQSLIIATILNIILNYIFIFSLLPYGSLAAVYGATIATIISKVSYLGMLFINKK